MMKKSVNSEPALAPRRRWLPALTALAIGIVALATACSGGDEPGAPDPEASTVTLRLNIAAVDPAGDEGSRAEFEPEASVREMMRTLRIIIVHADPADKSRKVVEFNQFWDLAGEAGADDQTKIAASATKEINVYAGDEGEEFDMKDIYVIANEHAHYSGYTHSAAGQDDGSDLLLAGIDLSNAKYCSGTHLDDAALAALEQLTFSMDKGKDMLGLVPMAEHHQVKVRRPKVDALGHMVDKEQAVSLFLTRVLVKVTVNVVNNSSGPLELTGYRLTNMAPAGYLFPYRTEYSPAKAECQTETTIAPREITAYAIPAGQQLYQFERTFKVLPATATPAEREDPYAFEALPAGKSRTLPSVYLPESQAEAGFGINLSLFGEYQVAAQPLTDLAGKLPRNTHLYITATVSDIGVSFEAWVQPYREVNLRPGFGLPKK